MARCPHCHRRLSWLFVLKGIDLTIFPDNVAPRCPACGGGVVPVVSRVLLGLAGLPMLIYAIYRLTRSSDGLFSGTGIDALPTILLSTFLVVLWMFVFSRVIQFRRP